MYMKNQTPSLLLFELVITHELKGVEADETHVPPLGVVQLPNNCHVLVIDSVILVIIHSRILHIIQSLD